MAVYWVTECIPVQITALMPIILFPFMGIMVLKIYNLIYNYYNYYNLGN